MRLGAGDFTPIVIKLLAAFVRTHQAARTEGIWKFIADNLYEGAYSGEIAELKAKIAVFVGDV